MFSTISVLNGYWYGGDNNIMSDASSVPPISDAVIESVGLSNSLVNSGPAYPFLIGKSINRVLIMAARTLI